MSEELPEELPEEQPEQPPEENLDPFPTDEDPAPAEIPLGTNVDAERLDPTTREPLLQGATWPEFASEPQPQDDSIVQRLLDVEAQVIELSNIVRQNARPQVYLANSTSSGTWQEAFVANGTIVTPGTVGLDKRGCTSSGDTFSQIINIGANNSVVFTMGDSAHEYAVLIQGASSNGMRFVLNASTAISGGANLMGGCYAMKSVLDLPTQNLTANANLTLTNLGSTANGSADVYGINFFEYGTANHDLLSTTNAATVVISLRSAGTFQGYPVYDIDHYFTGCS